MGVPEDLNLLERNIERLKFEYDQYFMGVTKVPPHTIQSAVDRLIQKYAATSIHNSAHRFRYQNLVARYNSLRELWKRRMRMKEEGIAIGMPYQPSGVIHPTAPKPVPATQEQKKDSKTTSTQPKKTKIFTATTKEPQKEKEVVDSIYREYLRAQQNMRRSPKTVSPESFRRLIEKQVNQIKKSYKCTAVDFRIDVRDGEVKLKAKPVK